MPRRLTENHEYGSLSEKQLFGMLEENLRLGAEACDNLASGKRGAFYLTLMRHVKIIEQCCRYIGAGPNGRQDARWLQFGLKAEEVHKRAGDWLRARDPSWRFKGLAEVLRQAQHEANVMRHKKTGRSGVILPKAQRYQRDNRPVQIILPDDYQRKVAASPDMAPTPKIILDS